MQMKKKWMIILSAIVIATMLLGALAAPEIIQRRETLGITLTVKDATPTGATLQCVRRIGFIAALVNTGRSYSVQRWTPEGWERIPYLSGEAVCWPDDAILVPFGISQKQLDYGDLYGPLQPGVYRVRKRYFSYRDGWGVIQKVTLYARFEIK